MKRNANRLLLLIAISILSLAASVVTSTFAQAAPVKRPLFVPNQINGTVFLDFNHNGIQTSASDRFEPGLGGITVTAYNAAGGVVSTTVSAATTGAYTLAVPTGQQVRIEFTGQPSYLQPGFHTPADANNSDGGTTVVFATGGDVNVNMAFTNPNRYCEPAGAALPNISSSCFVSGTNTGGYRNLAAVVTFPYQSGVTGQTPSSAAAQTGHTAIAQDTAVGAVWGLAYQRQSNRLLAASFMKRHVPYGPYPSPTGIIYILNPSGPNPAPGVINLDTYFGPQTAGQNTHLTTDYFNDNSVAPNTADSVGKYGLGGLAFSDDETTLYTINLFDRQLYILPVGIPAAAPAPGSITRVALPSPADCPLQGGVDERRPFAVSVYNGLVYIGMVCSGEAGGAGATARLRAYVYSYNGASFAQVIDVTMNYPRGLATNNGTTSVIANWNAWINNSDMTAAPVHYYAAYNQYVYPQPLVSGITFDEQGYLILGITDRFGHQTGNENGAANSGPIEGVSAGDTLRFRPNGATFTQETGGNDGFATVGNFVGGFNAASADNQGPGGGEFYFRDAFGATHNEVSVGAVLAVPGTGEVISSVFDPASDYRAGGYRYWNNYRATDDSGAAINRGDRTRSFELFGQDVLGSFGKASGIGDIEPLCSAEPLEIGNRLWFDTNNNGRQDPGEATVPDGVLVELRDATGAVIATTTTVNGIYYFNNGNVPGGLLTNTTYYVSVAASNFGAGGPLNGYVATAAFATGAALNDSNGQTGVVPGNPGLIGTQVITGGPGFNNHTYDFGFNLPDTPTPTTTNTATSTATSTPSATDTPSNTPTATDTPSNTPTATDTLTLTATASDTPTATNTATQTPTNTPTATDTATPTATNTPTATDTSTIIPTATATATHTPTGSATATPSSTSSPTGSATNTDTPSASPSASSTSTQTATATASLTPSSTGSATATNTGTPTGSATVTGTATPTGSATATGTATGSATVTGTATPTGSATVTGTVTSTATATLSGTPPTATNTAVPGLVDPTIVKLSDPQLAQPGETVTFAITISNPNSVAISGISVTDPVPDPFIIQSVSTPQGTYTINGNFVSFKIGTLAAGQTLTMRIVTRVRSNISPPLDVDNVATLDWAGHSSHTGSSSVHIVGQVTLPATGEHPDDTAWIVVGAGLVALFIAGVWIARRRRLNPNR